MWHWKHTKGSFEDKAMNGKKSICFSKCSECQFLQNSVSISVAFISLYSRIQSQTLCIVFTRITHLPRLLIHYFPTNKHVKYLHKFSAWTSFWLLALRIDMFIIYTLNTYTYRILSPISYRIELSISLTPLMNIGMRLRSFVVFRSSSKQMPG
jgi:hypothetical protein